VSSTRAGEDAECSSDNGACKRGDSGGWSTEADAFLSSSRCNIRRVYMRWQDGGISAENFRRYKSPIFALAHKHPLPLCRLTEKIDKQVLCRYARDSSGSQGQFEMP
jgi:hypothetical protein